MSKITLALSSHELTDERAVKPDRDSLTLREIGSVKPKTHSVPVDVATDDEVLKQSDLAL